MDPRWDCVFEPRKASQPRLWPATSKLHTCSTTPCLLPKQKRECSAISVASFPNPARSPHPISKTGLGVNWSAQSPERCIEPCCAAKAVSWWIKKTLTKQCKLSLCYYLKQVLLLQWGLGLAIHLTNMSITNVNHGDLGQILEYILAAMQATILKII